MSGRLDDAPSRGNALAWRVAPRLFMMLDIHYS
jgi:hypothetical protein